MKETWSWAVRIRTSALLWVAVAAVRGGVALACHRPGPGGRRTWAGQAPAARGNARAVSVSRVRKVGRREKIISLK